MTRLEPDLDAYGKLARRTALADLLELQALEKPSASVAELADYVRDSGWLRRLREPFHVPDGAPPIEVPDNILTEPEEEVEEEGLSHAVDATLGFADEVFGEVADRAVVLGENYPFAVRGERLHYVGPSDYRHPYLVLLGIALAHAYQLVLSFDPRQYFETVVTESLKLRGLLAANVASERRGSASLGATLVAVGRECKLSPTPDAAVTRRAAQEEGVDVVGHLYWGDSRPLHWVFIVQATCAVSDEWRYKLKEPAVPMWRRLLGMLTTPLACLAVPHHVPSDIVAYLIQQDEQRFILDRLRIYHPHLPIDALAEQLINVLVAAAAEVEM